MPNTITVTTHTNPLSIAINELSWDSSIMLYDLDEALKLADDLRDAVHSLRRHAEAR